VRARLERVGGATTTLTLTRSGGVWSATTAGLPAPSEWVVTVVATGPGGTAERVAEVTAPAGGGTTLTHICPL
jgi:hypothetical protein